MSKKRTPGRSLEEWMELVTECRQSGLTDALVFVYSFFRKKSFLLHGV